MEISLFIILIYIIALVFTIFCPILLTEGHEKSAIFSAFVAFSSIVMSLVILSNYYAAVKYDQVTVLSQKSENPEIDFAIIDECFVNLNKEYGRAFEVGEEVPVKFTRRVELGFLYSKETWELIK